MRIKVKDSVVKLPSGGKKIYIYRKNKLKWQAGQ